jgi:2-dehydro-3-deoxyphosphogluconate aldolase/(4S)-4-hydroxy-2-oxoglutarate aldolase
VIRASLPDPIVESRVIAVLRGLFPEQVEAVTATLRESGISVIEVTMDSPEAERSIRQVADTDAVVGAGTVISVAEAEAAVTAGASFVVAPHTDLAVVQWATERGVPIVPGAFTPTEVMTAWNAGAAAVKVFPASVGGPDYLKALAGPLGGVPLIPTGGITAEIAPGFLAAGAVAVGLGGWLTSHSDLEVVARRAAATVKACSA